MGGAASRAIGLVRKVVAVATRPRGESQPLVLGERAAVKVLNVSSALARQLARAPFPEMPPAQRITMQALAAQLRAVAGSVLPTEASLDPTTLEGALAEAVIETLRLVDAALLGVPAMAPGRADDAPTLLPQTRGALGEGDGDGERSSR